MTRTVKPTRIATVLALALAASAFVATPAQAQAEGWYDGAASDGSQFSLYVYRDVNTGALQIAQYGYYGLLSCPSGTRRQENTAFGAWVPAQPHLDIENKDEGFYTRLTGDFSADGSTFTGTGLMSLPRFVDVDTSHKRAETCSTGTRTIVATRSATAPTRAPAMLLLRGQWLHTPAAH